MELPSTETTTFGNGQKETLQENEIIKIISSNQIYNLPLFETYLVIDCRRKSDYDREHIASALNYFPCESNQMEDKVKSLEDFANYASDSYINELWNPIILYGTDEDQAVTSHLLEFCERLKEFICARNEKGPETNPQEKKQRRSHGLFHNISEKTLEVWVLKGGYEDFRRNYPVLCLPSQSEDVTGGMSMVPLPFHISTVGRGVFVGSRAVKWTTELFQTYQIDCMLLDLQTFEKFSQPLTECAIETMITSLPDHPSNQVTSQWSLTQLYQFLDSSTQYIQDCISNSKRILIQLHGRSHSSMVIIAWFMRFHFQMSFEESYLELKKYLPKLSSSLTTILDENFLYKDQLKRWSPGGPYFLEDQQQPQEQEGCVSGTRDVLTIEDQMSS
jgi:rhodanese-related sulfurtransferase